MLRPTMFLTIFTATSAILSGASPSSPELDTHAYLIEQGSTNANKDSVKHRKDSIKARLSHLISSDTFQIKGEKSGRGCRFSLPEQTSPPVGSRVQIRTSLIDKENCIYRAIKDRLSEEPNSNTSKNISSSGGTVYFSHESSLMDD